MISKYAIVQRGIVTGFCLWDGGRDLTEIWAGGKLVPVIGECCIGAQWDGVEFQLKAPVILDSNDR